MLTAQKVACAIFAAAIWTEHATCSPIQVGTNRKRFAIAPVNPVFNEIDSSFRVTLEPDAEVTSDKYIWAEELNIGGRIMTIPGFDDKFSFALLDSSSSDVTDALADISTQTDTLAFVAHLDVPDRGSMSQKLLGLVDNVSSQIPYQAILAGDALGSTIDSWGMTTESESRSYSFNAGAAHIIMLDSNPVDPGKQALWLVRDLLSVNRSWHAHTIVLISSAMENNLSPEDWDELQEILRYHRVIALSALEIEAGDDVWQKVTVWGPGSISRKPSRFKGSTPGIL